MTEPLRAEIRTFAPPRPLRLELRDRLDHPMFYWPRTLLSWPVRLEGPAVRAEELVLLRLDSEARPQRVPWQLSRAETGPDGRLVRAVLHFFSDLPPGGQRVFELTTTADPRAKAPLADAPSITRRDEGDAVELDSGAVRVRLPASRAATDGNLPGPILAMDRGTGWLGDSRLVVPGAGPASLKARTVESGPLFVDYLLTYTFQGGAMYEATVRVMAGLDWVRLRERATGLPRGRDAFWELAWTGLDPTHRAAPNHPDRQRRLPGKESRGWDRFPWERIDERLFANPHGVRPGLSEDGELPFRLGIYQPWGAYLSLTFGQFWSDRSGDAVGVFIDKPQHWQDHEYALWSASTTLQVRYYWRDGVLRWHWPVVTGTRSTGIACYDHARDLAEMDRIEEFARGVKWHDGQTYRPRPAAATYLLRLQNRFGTLDLDEVKDWVLSYPPSARRPPAVFSTGRAANPGELLRLFTRNGLIESMALHGSRQNVSFHPVGARQVYEQMTDAYLRLADRLDAKQRERVTAAFLLLAHVAAGDDWMPMQTMLAGHPNFLADVKSIPGLAAFVFPEHPRARQWADLFQRFVELNTRYHTRPPVAAHDSAGGRWTENLGTYVWAHMRPALRASWALGEHFDGRNRFAGERMAWIGNWVVDALTAPFAGESPEQQRDTPTQHYWGMVTPENGPRRVHPPQGAHAFRRMPPRSMWLLGHMLRNYAPLTAEHMMWAARPTDEDSEQRGPQAGAWEWMSDLPDNRGTDPHLRSCKYTGYGCVLRADVGGAGEVSVHVQQIDHGPNYRWGIHDEAGAGMLYYYAAGRAFSHNGREDTGDRRCQDTDFCCNFGVWKDGRFKAIGRNVLDRPLYDLGWAQMAELRPRPGKGAYAWPEYQFRRVLLMGVEYLATYDAVYADSIGHRWSWFTNVHDAMPHIYRVLGSERRQLQRTSVTTDETKGVWYDGKGDSLVVVSHTDGLEVDARAYGCLVKGTGFRDHLFLAQEPFEYAREGVEFEGTAGAVRLADGAATKLVLLDGKRVGAGGVVISVEGLDVGLSAELRGKELTGRFVAPRGAKVTVTAAEVPPSAAAYVEGDKLPTEHDGQAFVFTLPPGRGSWQLTAELPVPAAPRMLRTVNRSGGAKVYFQPGGGAERHRIELSRDGGRTWQPAGQADGDTFELKGLANGRKVHVRAVPCNARAEGPPADEYPLYVMDQPPAPPDGLHMTLRTGRVELTWGEVLGASEYRLYRRRQGEQEFERIHTGLERRFAEGIDVPGPCDRPGGGDDPFGPPRPEAIHEYAVSAVNGNGEGPRSGAVDTDPSSWLNWDPMPGEAFRRRLTYNVLPYEADDATELYYPGTAPR